MKLNKDKMEVLINFYMLICGTISVEDIDKIKEFYDIDIDEETINKILKDNEYYLIDGYYYKDKAKLDDALFEVRDNLEIKLLPFEEIEKYLDYLDELRSEVKKIVKNEDIVQDIMLSETSYKMISDFDVMDDYLFNSFIEDMKINDDEFFELLDLFYTENDIRYWCYYGRTTSEYKLNIVKNDMCMIEKPKNGTLSECLKLITNYAVDSLKFNLMLDEDENLEESIINLFKAEILTWSKEYYEEIKNHHEKEIDESVGVYDLENGYFFIYEEDNKYKLFIPTEIRKIINKTNIDDLLSFNDMDFEYNIFDDVMNESNDELISYYLQMNGVLEKETLVKLLKEYHGLDYTTKQIDKIVKKFDYFIIDKKYYSAIEDKDIINELLKIRGSNNQYKKYELGVIEVENEFINEFDYFLNQNFPNLLDINNYVLTMIKCGSFTKELLQAYLEEYGVKNSDINKIYEFIKPYKNEISIWTRNGYCLKDNTQKSTKVGRNDPCPCGSGRKYKQCHGK